MQDNKIDQVIDILEIQGWQENDIADLVFEISKASTAKLYADASLHFTEEDLQTIEACETEEEADIKIKELYKLRVGSDPEEKAQELLNVFAAGFLEEYNKPQPTP